MKDLYLLIHAGTHPSQGSCYPAPHPCEAAKTEAQFQFSYRTGEIRKKDASVVIIGKGEYWIEDMIKENLLFKFKGDWPTDKEVKHLNGLLRETEEDHCLIPAGLSSADCVPAILGMLLYGQGYRLNGKEVTLNERLAVKPENLHIIPELLVPQTKTLYLHGKH